MKKKMLSSICRAVSFTLAGSLSALLIQGHDVWYWVACALLGITVGFGWDTDQP